MGPQKKDEMRITMREEMNEDSQNGRRSIRSTGGAVFDGLSQNSHSLSPAITWENPSFHEWENEPTGNGSLVKTRRSWPNGLFNVARSTSRSAHSGRRRRGFQRM